MPTIWLWGQQLGATAVKQGGSFASKHNGQTCTQCCTTARVVKKSKKLFFFLYQINIRDKSNFVSQVKVGNELIFSEKCATLTCIVEAAMQSS